MVIEWLYLLTLCTSLILNIIIAGVTWTRRTSLVGTWYIALVSTAAIVLASFLFFSIGENHSVVFFWVRIRFGALSIAPYVLVGFVLVYTGYSQWFQSKQRYLLIIPILTNTIIWFAPHLFWQSWNFTHFGVINVESAVYTGWFVVYAIYGITNILAASIITLRYALQATHNSRRPVIGIIVSITFSLAIGLLPTFGITRNLFNPFPISLSIIVIAYGWALFRAGLLKLSPLAYKTIIENMMDAVYVFDAQNCLVLLNKHARQILEIEDSQSILGKSVFDIFPDEIELVTQYKDIWDARFESYPMINSEKHTLDIRISPILNHRGENEYKLLVLRDITQSKQAEATLRQSELLYRSLFEQPNDGVFMLNMAGDFIAVNQRGADMIGYTVEEALELGFGNLSVELPQSHHILEQLLAREVVPPYERPFRHKDGHIFMVEINAKVVWDDDENPIYIQSIVRDISERKQAEAKLRKSELQYRSLFEQSSDAVYIVDAKSEKTIAVNQRAFHMTGYTSDEALQFAPTALSSEPSQSQHIYDRLLTGEIIPPYEREIHHKDGHIFPVEVNAEIIRDDEGDLIYIQTIVRDITERKQAETALRKSELQYRSLFEQSNDGVFIVDTKGKYLNVNQRATDMLGYTMDEALQLSVSDVSAELEHSNHVIDRLLAGNVIPIYERQFRHKDGHIFPMEISVEMVWDDDGSPIYIQTIARDITERKQAEAKLRKSELIYRSLFEQEIDAVFIVDVTTRKFISVNQRAADMLGYTLDEVLQLSISDVSTNLEHSEHISDRLLAQEVLPIYEKKFRHKEGHTFPVEISVSMLRDDDGNPIYLQSIVRDITERKQAEAALRQSELRYRSLFEQSNDAVFIFDITTNKFIAANQRATDMLGYTLEEVLQLSTTDLSAELPQSQRILERLLVGEVAPPYERKIRHKDGHIILVEIKAEIIRDDNGIPIYRQSVVQNISERKQAEAAQRQSELQYRSLFEQSNDAVYIIDTTGLMIAANQRATEMSGYSLKELLNRNFTYSSMEPSDSQKVFERLLAGEVIPPYERKFRHKNGSIISVEVNAEIIWDDEGNPIHIQSIIRDISERKQTEASLLESEARQSAMIQAIPDMIFTIRADGTLLDLHMPVSDDLTLSDRQREGNISKFLSEEELQEQLEIYQHVLETGEIAVIEHVRVVNGTQYYFEARIAPLGDNEIVAIIRDVTQARQAQQQEFELALEKERNQLLTTFIQDASHEFRTPLSIINTGAYIIKQTDDKNRRQVKVEQIQQQVERINYLVDMMTQMIQLDNISPSMHLVSLSSFVQSVINVWQNRTSTPIHLHNDSASPPHIMGNHELLQEALSALIDNAQRFGDDDNIVDIRMSHTDEHVIISIQDKGVGISKDDLLRIFDAFWRNDVAHSTPGLGLGLTIAQKTIQLHNGSIQVESEVNKGSRFDIILPIAVDNP